MKDRRPDPLSSGEVHLWLVRLEGEGKWKKALAGILSPEERERASRFRYGRDKDAFVIHHGALRRILSLYTPGKPERHTFGHGRWGKPRLETPGGGDPPAFNISRSGLLGVVALSRGRRIGVDVELVRPFPDAALIARRFFSKREATALEEIPAPLRLRAFYDCWTRKEAFVKATGKGLSLLLDSFSVSCAPGEPAAILDAEVESAPLSEWSMSEPALPAFPGYAGALVVEGGGWRLCTRDFGFTAD